MLPIRLDPHFDPILRKHLQRAAKREGIPLRELERAGMTPADALDFLRAIPDAYEAYVDESCAAVNNVGWILIDKRTGRQIAA